MKVAELLVKIGAVSDAKQVNKALNNIKASANKMAANLQKSMNKAMGGFSRLFNTKDAMQGLSGLQKSMKSLTGLMGLNLGTNLLQMLAPDAISEARKKISEFFNEIIKNSAGVKELGKIIKTLMNEVLGLLKKLRPYIERLIKTTVNMIQRVVTFLQRLTRPIKEVIDKFGGLEAVLQAVLLVAGLLFVALNFSTVIASISKILKLLNPMTLVLLTIALIVEDFIFFMQGKGSVFEEVLEGMGIDADEARESIMGWVTSLRDELLPELKEVAMELGGEFLSMAKEVIGAIIEFAVENKDLIKEVLLKLPGLIGNILKIGIRLAGFIMKTGLKVIGWLIKNFHKMEPFLTWLTEDFIPDLIDKGGDLLDPLLDLLDVFLNPLIDLLNSEEFKGFLNDMKDTLLPAIKDAIKGIKEFLEPVINAIANLIKDNLPKIKPLIDPILEIVRDIAPYLGTIGEALGVIVGWISKLVGYGLDQLTNFFNALAGNTQLGGYLSGGASGYSGATDEASLQYAMATGYATGSEETDEAFLAGEHGPELVTGQSGKKVFTALSTRKINEALNMIASMAQPAQPVVNNSGRNVTQNVNITNNFSGSRDAQTSGATAMDKSARSATDYMAHALNYGRI